MYSVHELHDKFDVMGFAMELGWYTMGLGGVGGCVVFMFDSGKQSTSTMHDVHFYHIEITFPLLKIFNIYTMIYDTSHPDKL